MKHSVYGKLVFLFIATFFLVCFLFIILLKLEKHTRYQEDDTHQKNVIRGLVNIYDSDYFMDFSSYLANSGFEAIKDLSLIKRIKKNSKVVYKYKGKYCSFYSLDYQNSFFISINCKNYSGLFKQSDNNKVYNLLLFGFFFFLFVVCFMYFSVLKSFEPIKRLRKEVNNVTHGEKANFEDYEDNEIGKIAKEFKRAFSKNQELIESRQLFLRAIMHELKTPIGKGRIISEMIQEEKQKFRLIDIFERLDSLIDEFAKIERLFSKNYNLCIKPYNFSTILSEARIYLMRDDFDSNVSVKYFDDPILYVDLEIFSLILKNMLDNALKYSNNDFCEVECYENSFIVKNTGSPLSHPIEYYFEAFSREKNEKVKGMGLGLYIVFEICKMHGFNLLYKYEDDKHCFEVVFKS